MRTPPPVAEAAVPRLEMDELLEQLISRAEDALGAQDRLLSLIHI